MNRSMTLVWKICFSLLSIFLVFGALSCGGGGKVKHVDPPSIVEDVTADPGGHRVTGEDVVLDIGELWTLDGKGWDGWTDPEWKEDGGDPCDQSPAPFGCPCATNGDCESGYCVQGPAGNVCTQNCFEECPEGWDCVGTTGFGRDLVFLCIPHGKALCTPCLDGSDCANGLCIELDGKNVCSYGCTSSGGCPSFYHCDEVEVDGESKDVCLPQTLSCDCLTENAGDTRMCEVSNAHGTCKGEEACDSDQGWVGCDALTPAVEACDGQDNNCDGQFDEGLGDWMPCEESVDGIGTCLGISTCLGVDGWGCTAPAPAAESCDVTVHLG